MPLPTPEQVAAAQAAVRRQPPSSRIVDAPYDVIDVAGQIVKQGTPVWRYISGRQYGGPSDMSLAAAKADKPVEYSYLNLAAASRRGWRAPSDEHSHSETQDGESWLVSRCIDPDCQDYSTRV